MNIEEIFKRTQVEYEKLIKYGFKKENESYIYIKNFIDGFKAIITVNEKGNISGKVYDLSTNEEYLCINIQNTEGTFINNIKEEYRKLLQDIADKCFKKQYFITEQANRITELIINKYNNKPEFVWAKSPGNGIFRNPNNEKWYGLIMNIDRSKLEKNKTGEVEVINLKLDTKKIQNLINKKGFYTCYHMNKKNWITIILDDTISDNEIMKYVEESHQYTEYANEIIIPANPKYYDVINCFNDTDTIIWKQSSNIKENDIIYIYVGAPYSAILYKCLVTKANIPYEYNDSNITIKKAMEIKLLKKYDKDLYPFKILKENGVNAIRGPRSITKKLSVLINKGEV